ncbi:hypothetical protein EV421DRAFT_1743445 [Armillaria borealis]|uniref:Uncharacterized protein n=1 Tax=Armillaria borealis TaxID=47425 RepID=A0AA39IWJ4_9AGAR|nr:hypothetical protein EV421DRAFT_1743445 [Armillaria borealis]
MPTTLHTVRFLVAELGSDNEDATHYHAKLVSIHHHNTNSVSKTYRSGRDDDYYLSYCHPDSLLGSVPFQDEKSSFPYLKRSSKTKRFERIGVGTVLLVERHSGDEKAVLKLAERRYRGSNKGVDMQSSWWKGKVNSGATSAIGPDAASVSTTATGAIDFNHLLRVLPFTKDVLSDNPQQYQQLFYSPSHRRFRYFKRRKTSDGA